MQAENSQPIAGVVDESKEVVYVKTVPSNGAQGAPPWAVNLIRSLERNNKDLQRKLRREIQHKSRGHRHRRRSKEAREREARAAARKWNARAAAFNAKCIARYAVTPIQPPFRRFRKFIAGVGPVLPESPPLRRSLPVLQLDERVPAEFFPTDYEELQTWTHEQINELSVIMNFSFGIRAGDSVLRRRLLQSHLASTS